MAGIDFETSPDSLRLGYLVRVEYTGHDAIAKGALSPAVARWCGPRKRTLSGIAYDVDDGDGRVFWEPRLNGLEFDRDLGPLGNHVQSLGRASFKVQMGDDDSAAVATAEGPGNATSQEATFEGLLAHAVAGRWEGRRVDVWLVNLDPGGQVLAHQHRFFGRVDKGPGKVRRQGFRLTATEGIPLLEAQWPATRVDNTLGFNHVFPAIIDTGPGSVGGVLHQYHPGSIVSENGSNYVMKEAHLGAWVGVVFGTATSDDTIWREVMPYGWNERPDVVNGRNYFFFVSQQTDVYVRELWWEDPNSLNLLGVDDDSLTVNSVETFENRNPLAGPLGTCCRLKFDDTVTPGWEEPFPRFYAKIDGPGSAYPLTATAENGAFIRKQGLSASQATRDDEILEYIFTHPDMLDLGSSASVFGSGSLSAFTAEAPNGPAGLNSYRRFHCAIPLNITTALPPLLREVMGEFFTLIQGDLTYRYDPAVDAQRLFPIRRRPNPVRPDADFTIRAYNLISGHMSRVDEWQLSDDPDGHYANEFSGTSPDFYGRPTQQPASNEAEIAVIRSMIGSHVDGVEQQPLTFQRSLSKKFTGMHWVPEDTTVGVLDQTGMKDAVEFMGRSRSQPQKVVDVDLGVWAMAVQLGDTVEYDLQGLRALGVGQVRKLIEDIDAQVIRLTSYHINHFDSASSRPSTGAEGKSSTEKKDG